VNTSTPSAAIAASAPPSAAEREVKLTAWLVVSAVLAGSVLQVWVPPGGLTLVAGAALAGVVAIGVAFLAPGRLRETLAGFRFISTVLFVLAFFAILGTLVLQGKPSGFYVQRYGALGSLIVALRLDDVFHGLPFALVIALFGASVIASAALRWPIKLNRAGFFICHVGLLTSLAGAAASTSLALRGRIDLHAGGEQATHVRLTRAGVPTGEYAQLGFDLRLDKFDLVNYATEYRIGYYEQRTVRDEKGVPRETWRLVASFDPDLEKHRLPSGDSFRLKGVYPDFLPLSKAAPASTGAPALQVTVAGVTQWLSPGQAIASPDGAVAVVFGWERPAAPQGGAMTAVLVSGADRKVVVHRADGSAEQPYADGLALLGGAVKLGSLYEHASRSVEYGTVSQEWKNPAALLEVQQQGLPKEQLMSAVRPSAFMLGPTRALVFEKRDKEVKAFVSNVTARQGSTVDRRAIAVNDPMTFGGWTLYQVNYNPEDPTYSGIEAVYDPGVIWVFTGFALISLGVFYMFYVEPRLKRAAAAAKA
jgi:hypothetical protein